MDYTLCRLCYEREANISIFQRGCTKIISRILYCCKFLNVKKNDGLPARICTNCDTKLEACYQFLQMCETSHRELWLLLSLDFPKKEVECKVDEEDYESNNGDDQLSPTKDNIVVKLEQDQLGTAEKPILKKTRFRKKTSKHEFNCFVCGKNCMSPSALEAHLRIHTNERPYQCTSCDKKYKDGGTLKRHIERNHIANRERKFMCESCGKGFYSKGDIQIHMRIHTGETPYSCSVCLARFGQKSGMLRHKKRHTEEKPYVCGTCEKSFYTKDELKKHFSTHNDVRNFECPICKSQFKQKSNIKKHMVLHTDPHKYVCNHCDRTFNLKGSLKNHINRKHSEKSGHCKICSKSFSNIEIHMLKHSGKRPLICEFCPSSFYEMKALSNHINFRHMKTDKFKCTMEGCTLAFPSRPMLLYHVARYHEMHTPYPCDRCSRGFYRKNDLARHKLGTHKERLL